MKKLFRYEVNLDLGDLRYTAEAYTLRVIKEKKDSYLVVCEGDRDLYKEVKVIFKSEDFSLDGGVYQYDGEDGSKYYVSGFLYDDEKMTDKEVKEREKSIVRELDGYYEEDLKKFFVQVENLRDRYEDHKRMYRR